MTESFLLNLERCRCLCPIGITCEKGILLLALVWNARNEDHARADGSGRGSQPSRGTVPTAVARRHTTIHTSVRGNVPVVRGASALNANPSGAGLLESCCRNSGLIRSIRERNRPIISSIASVQNSFQHYIDNNNAPMIIFPPLSQ